MVYNAKMIQLWLGIYWEIRQMELQVTFGWGMYIHEMRRWAPMAKKQCFWIDTRNWWTVKNIV
jgi:hypothetical protein